METSALEQAFKGSGDLGLEVKEISRLFKALQDEAPKTGSVREIVSNSDTAGATRIDIRTVKVGRNNKVAFIDNGTGLDAEGLYALRNLYGSSKGDDFFGTGVRVLTAPTNQMGTVFQSRVDGVTRFAKFYIKNGEPLIELSEGAFPTLKLGKLPTGNYTAVILLGNNAGQDTFKIPYGDLTKANPIKEQIETRFYNKTQADIFVEGEAVEHLADRLAKGESYTVEAPLGDVTFVYTIKGSNTSGVVYDNELYYPSKGKAKLGLLYDNATPVLKALDAAHVSDKLSVVVIINDTSGLTFGQHRDKIFNKDTGEDLDLAYFSQAITKFVPSEVEKYIDDQRVIKFSKIKIDNPYKEEDLKILNSLVDETPKTNSELGDFDAVIPRPKARVFCPECGHDITGLNGGEKCDNPKIDCPYIKPTRKTPVPNPNPNPNTKKSRAAKAFKVVVTNTADYPINVFVLRLGDTLYFNPDSALFEAFYAQTAHKKVPLLKRAKELAGQLEILVRPILRTTNVKDDQEATLIACKALAVEAVRIGVKKYK